MDLTQWLQGREGQANSKKRNRAAFRDTRGSSTTPNNRRLQKNYGGSSYTMGRLALQKKLKSHRGCVNTLSFNSSGDKLVSGSDDCHIKIWDPHECTLIHSFHAQHSSNIFCAKFLPFTGDDQIVSCAADGEVRWHTLSTNVITPFFCNGDRVKKLALEPSSSYVFFSCSEDATVRMYDVRERHDCSHRVGCERSILIDLREGDSGMGSSRAVRLNSLAVNECNSNYLVLGGSDPTLRVYDRRMITGNHQGCVYRFQPLALDQNQRGSRHITGVNYSHDGRRVLASYGGDHVYLFDVSSAMSHPTTTIQIPQPVADTARHDDDDQQMPDSAPEGGEEENKERDEANKVTMEDDEEEEINKRRKEEENKAAMEDDEEEKEQEEATRKEKKKSLASATITREFLRTYRGHANVQTVKEINFIGPESKFVASGSDDGRIFIWETETGTLVNILEGDSDVVNCVRSHPLGYPLLATSGIESNVKIWLPTAEEANALAEAEEIMQTNERALTEEPAPFHMSQRMMFGIMQLLAQRQAARDAGEDGDVECIQS